MRKSFYELLVTGVLFKRDIVVKRYLHQIADYRGWYEKPAEIRMKECIRELLSLGVKLADLSFVNMGNILISKEYFNGTSFKSARLTNGQIVESTFKSCDFSWINAEYSCFDSSKFYDANFFKANLKESSFKNGRLENVKLEYSKMGRSCFEDASLNNVLISNSDLNQAAFRHCKIFNCDFQTADLSSSNFEETVVADSKLIEANLSKAFLGDVIFKNSDLSGVNLDGAIVSTTDWLEKQKAENNNGVKELERLFYIDTSPITNFHVPICQGLLHIHRKHFVIRRKVDY